MNLAFELPDERLLAGANQFIRYFVRGNDEHLGDLKKEFLFVNCTYDKMLTPYADENGTGQIAITDRQKLARLLSILQQAQDRPKLVIVDLLFIEPSPFDSVFVSELARSENLILGVDPEEGSIPMPTSIKKALPNYYTASSSFLKYPVLNNGTQSLPTAMYAYLQHKEVSLNWLGFVRMADELWLNSFIVDLEMRKQFLLDNRLAYVNLGELLQLETPERIAESAANRIVIIGDVFVNDQHKTVLGEQPGPMIFANAYLGMLKGQAAITRMGSLLLLLFYFVMSWRLFSMAAKATTVANSATPKFLRFILKYVSYLVIFSLFSIVLYQILDKHFQILLFAFYFNALDFLIKRYKDVRRLMAFEN